MAGAVVLGMVLSAPSMLVLLIGIPGNCASSPEFCVMWEMLGLLALTPVYLGIAGAFLAVKDAKGFYFRWVRRLAVLIPLMVTLCTLAYILKPVE